MTWETNESQVLPLFTATDRHRNCVGSPIQFSTCRSALGGRLRGSPRCRWMERSQQGWSAVRDGGRGLAGARPRPLGQLVLRALVFGLREGLETVVMLRAIALFLVHRGRRHQLRSGWIASGAAAARCLVIALIGLPRHRQRGAPSGQHPEHPRRRQRRNPVSSTPRLFNTGTWSEVVTKDGSWRIDRHSGRHNFGADQWP